MHQDAGSQTTAWQTDRLCPMLFQGHEHAGVRARPRKPFQEGEQGRLLRGGGWIYTGTCQMSRGSGEETHPGQRRKGKASKSRSPEAGVSLPPPPPSHPDRQPAGRWGPRKGKGEAGTPRRPGRVGVSWVEFCILEGDVS